MFIPWLRSLCVCAYVWSFCRVSQFTMRRSAGFALAFLSILKAEPPNMPVTLLPIVMQRLLSHAFNGDVPAVYAKALGYVEATKKRLIQVERA